MASFTGKAAGNWSAEGQTTWNEAGTPAAGDTADLNGMVIVMDIATIPAGGGALTLLKSTGAGQLTVNLATLGHSVINAAAITAGTKSGGLILVSGAAPGTTLTISNDGSACPITAGSADNAHGLSTTSTGTVIITGAVQGGTGIVAIGVSNGGTGAVQITGNVTGGSAAGGYSRGVSNAGGGSATIIGNVTGGGPVAHGLYLSGSSVAVITGNITGGSSDGVGIKCEGSGAVAITGNITGGSYKSGFGVWNAGTSVVTLNSCNMINSASTTAYVGKPPVWNNATGANYAQWNSTQYAPVRAAAELIEGTINGDVVGNYHEATVAEVQDGVMFGPASAYEGTYEGAGGGVAHYLNLKN